MIWDSKSSVNANGNWKVLYSIMLYMLTESNACYRSTANDTELDLTNLDAHVRSFVQEYRKGHRDTKRLISSEALATRIHISTAIQGTNETIRRAGQDLGKLTLNLDAQVDQAKRERLLQSLKYQGFNERRNEVREAHTNTFQWVFAGDGDESAGPNSKTSTTKWDSFSNWLKSTDTVYWISGKPGSGKSTLIKYILADPQLHQCLEIWSPGCLLVSHYFWRPGSLMQRSIKGLFCSLLCQLLENSEAALGWAVRSSASSNMKVDVTDWSLEELQSKFLSTMEAYDRPVCMFLDGLDEVYPEQPRSLMDMIDKISVAGKSNLKMCLASRPEPPLQRRLYNMPQLRLQDLTAADLTRYVHDNLHVSNFTTFKRYASEDFAISLAKRAEGVFLWLVLVTKSVRNGFENGDPIEIIEERVQHLKGGDLESLYKDMWDRASKDNPDTYRRTAALYFRIMLLLYNADDNRYLRMYGQSPSVFTTMLATTEIAEKTLDAAPQPVSLAPEGTLLQSCKEVERIAETYCFGLLEVSQKNYDGRFEAMVGWYKGKYEKLLAYVQAQRQLVFIHRTAVDFLVNTAQGQEILSYDDTTESSHAIRLVTANLAHAHLFCDLGSIGASDLGSHLLSIDGVRRAYTDAEGSVTADYRRIMMHCKRLCDLEKLFASLGRPGVRVCSGVDFFKAVAMYHWSCLEILEDQVKALDKESLSEILRILCDSIATTKINTVDLRVEHFDIEALRFIKLLLLEGADPNWHGNTDFAWSARGAHALPYICQWTPFVAFLSQILNKAQSIFELDTEISRNESTKLLVTLQTFIRCGADFDAKITMFFYDTCERPSAESSAFSQYLKYNLLHPQDLEYYEYRRCIINGYGYVCSFPAHDILNLVLSKWEPLQQLSDKNLFAEVLSYVAYHSTCTVRRTDQTVLRRLEINPLCLLSREWRWCAAPREHQNQIGKELISLMNFSGRTVNTFQRPSSAETHAIGYETLTSMFCGPHWVVTGSGTRKSFLKHLVELGLFVRSSSPRKFHTLKDWLKLKGLSDPA